MRKRKEIEEDVGARKKRAKRGRCEESSSSSSSSSSEEVEDYHCSEEEMTLPPTTPSVGSSTDTVITYDMNSDIYRHLRSTENVTLITTNHLTVCQLEITDRMRAILVDWLVDVHLKYKCRPETMYLAVNVLDRYLMNKPVERQHLQLLGCASMLLACKYEETKAPEVRDFVHISANAYTHAQVVQMEKNVLVELDYNLTVPTMWQFLTQLTQVVADDYVNAGAEYLAEQTLMCGKLCGYAPSMQAAACMHLSRSVLLDDPEWPEELEAVSPVYQEESRDTFNEIVFALKEYMQRVPKLRITAVRKKYSHSKYHGVAKRFDKYFKAGS